MSDINPWLNINGDPGVQVFSMHVGGTAKICHSTFFKGVDYESEDPNASKYLQKGYRITYRNLGEFIDDSELEWNCVMYKHLKSGKQIIEFVEDLAHRKSYLVMQGVLVHDHASIDMGGPAYATYYSEPSSFTDEES